MYGVSACMYSYYVADIHVDTEEQPSLSLSANPRWH